ncbi:Cysteine repeat modular protein [Plasmodium coatneyi]|uniref:Cysteine repeat modular protein n=1 Tax=Plasmodium coatneyi TaxID=208452 RepID=A0A1B1DUG0_9APIC|nr:Cysteine repeat modular protein [Plasmodium coatneyi]ANQ06418.1 Cysteine repeat modular protein [Plasmodium coatneyi]
MVEVKRFLSSVSLRMLIFFFCCILLFFALTPDITTGRVQQLCGSPSYSLNTGLCVADSSTRCCASCALPYSPGREILSASKFCHHDEFMNRGIYPFVGNLTDDQWCSQPNLTNRRRGGGDSNNNNNSNSCTSSNVRTPGWLFSSCGAKEGTPLTTFGEKRREILPGESLMRRSFTIDGRVPHMQSESEYTSKKQTQRCLAEFINLDNNTKGEKKADAVGAPNDYLVGRKNLEEDTRNIYMQESSQRSGYDAESAPSKDINTSLKSLFLNRKKNTGEKNKRNNFSRNIERTIEFIEGNYPMDKPPLMHILADQMYIRTINQMTSVQIKGNKLDKFKYKNILIYDSFENCKGNIVEKVSVKEISPFHILTENFMMKKLGMFSICIEMEDTQYVALLKIQNNLIEQITPSNDVSTISAFNCALGKSSIFIPEEGNVRIVEKVGENLSQKSHSYDILARILRKEIKMLACSSFENYVVFLEMNYIIVATSEPNDVYEVISHFLTKPVGIFLDQHIIYVTDADRKNVFRYRSEYILKETAATLVFLDGSGEVGQVEQAKGEKGEKGVKSPLPAYHTQGKANARHTYATKKKRDYLSPLGRILLQGGKKEQIDYLINGENYLITKLRDFYNIRRYKRNKAKLKGLLSKSVTLVYPAGIVVDQEKVYFVDTALHMLFCFSMKEDRIIETFGYLNSPVMSNKGLNKPFSLSLFHVTQWNKSLLFLSELSSSIILIFEIKENIQLYLTYGNLPLDIATSIVVTAEFLIVCGLKRSKENYVNYVTYIKIEELSEFEIEYNEFPYTLHYGEEVNMTPLKRSSNIKKFTLRQYENKTNANIDTGLNIDKHSGMISGKVKISAWFHMEIVAYDYFNKITLSFENFISSCPKGFFFQSNNCVPCPIGYYTSNVHRLKCMSCENYQENSTTSYPGSISRNECLCKAGYYLEDKKKACVKCPAGYYKDQIGDFKCQSTCENMKRSLVEGAASYEELNCACKDGYYTDALSKCVPCYLNFYCIYNPNVPISKADIIPCKEHMVTLKRGSTSPKDCICSVGYYYDSETDTCKPCSYDTYKANQGNESCTPFVTNPRSTQEFLPNENYLEHSNIFLKKTSNVIISPRKGNSSSHSAKYCETGYFYSKNKSICSICRYNGYCEGLHNEVTTCPKNSVTVKLKSVTPMDCLCERGYGRITIQKHKSFNILCVPCPYNTFQPHHSSGECIPCPAYTFTISVKSTSITDCLPQNGYYDMYFQYIYQHTRERLVQNVPLFLQQYRRYVSDQYTNGREAHLRKGKPRADCHMDHMCGIPDEDSPLSLQQLTPKLIEGERTHGDHGQNQHDAQWTWCDKPDATNGYEKDNAKARMPKISNSIRNLKGTYSNAFYTNYLKNVILMDSTKMARFIQQEGSIFSLDNSPVGNNNPRGIILPRQEDSKEAPSKGERVLMKDGKQHSPGISIAEEAASGTLIDSNSNLQGTILLPEDMKAVVRKFNFIAQKRTDLLMLIKSREETYIENKRKDISYECYEMDRAIIIQKNVYVSTIPEIDLISCLNTCISNIYCTGIEMDRTIHDGKTDLFFFLNRSHGTKMIHFFKCYLYFYEEIASYYKKESLKKIEDIQRYDDADRITGCVVQKNEMLKLWKVYNFDVCPNNYYCPQKSFKKKKCPLNSVKKNFQGTIEDCLCSPGYSLQKNLNLCVPCEKGTYKDSTSNGKCIKCPLNLTTSSEASTSKYDCVCREGYYFHGLFSMKLVDSKMEQVMIEGIKKAKKNKILSLPNGENKVDDLFLQVKSSGRRQKFAKMVQAVLGESLQRATGKGEAHGGDNTSAIKENEVASTVKEKSFTQMGDTPIHVSHTPHAVQKHYNSLSSLDFPFNKLHDSEDSSPYGTCIKCPNKMFCPGFWFKNFERELHHPPIFCPNGSTVPKTTLESTDVHKCICGKGYSINVQKSHKNREGSDVKSGSNVNNVNSASNAKDGKDRRGRSSEMCVKCEEGYYKDVVDNSPCAGLCMEFSTSFQGSISKKQCFCSRGKYMIHESSHEMKCVNCSKGALCIGGLKYKSLKNLIQNSNYTDIEINDHVIPFPQKGYFATFEIKHDDFVWSPLNSLNVQINNYEKGDIIIKNKIAKQLFGGRVRHITVERNNQNNHPKKHKVEVKPGKEIQLGYPASKKSISLVEVGITHILVNEKLEKLKYKNEYLTVERIPDFHLCPISKRCVGGVDNLCAHGSEGYLCNNCSRNYDTIYFRSQCVKCEKTKTELIDLLARKIFFYMIVFFLIYLNYFCYVKRNFVFMGILKIWYFFIICFLPYIYIVESNHSSLPNHLFYFQFFITLPMRFLTHYLKLNCFVNSYSNQQYIHIWYIQRYIKIAEPMIDCVVLTATFLTIYLVYTWLKRKQIRTVERVIARQINKVHSKGYYQHRSDFYYQYYQKHVIDTINDKKGREDLWLKRWGNASIQHEHSSGEEAAKAKTKKMKTTKTPQRNSSTSGGNSTQCGSSAHLSTSDDSLRGNKMAKKELSSSNENLYNFDEEFLPNDASNYCVKENIAKDKYWTYMCALNIYNIKAFGLFRYIHPSSISTFSRIKRVLSDLKVLYIIVLYIYFPFTLISLLELVWCQPVKYKSKTPILVLYHMPSQVCNWGNKLFATGVIFSSVFFLMYLLLFIFSFYGTLKNFKIYGSYAKRVRSYFLFNGYNYQNRCWDLFNVIKVMFVAISFTCQLYTKRIDNAKYFICCCIVFILITEVTLILMYSPYDKRSNNILRKLSLLSTFSILITYLSVQFSFFFNFPITNSLPFVLFVYFHLYMGNKIVLEFVIYKNIFKSKEEKEDQQDVGREAEGLLNEQSFFNFAKQKSNQNGANPNLHADDRSTSGAHNSSTLTGEKKKKTSFSFPLPYTSVLKKCNLYDLLLRVNNIPFYSILFNEKGEEIFIFEKGSTRAKYEEIVKNVKMDTTERSQTGVISLDLLHSDLLYYNISDPSRQPLSNINYVDLKKRSTNWSQLMGESKLSNNYKKFLKREKEYPNGKDNNLHGHVDGENSRRVTPPINITHFINCLIEAINILFVNQSYNQINVEWISFVTRFSICFIHWMKNHDENLVNLVPINKKQFERKKRNLLFYSLFSSYAEVYSVHSIIGDKNKFEQHKKNFLQAENLEQFSTYLNEAKKKNPAAKAPHYSQTDDEEKSDCYTPLNFLNDEFYRCEKDIIKLLFDENIFKNLSISIVEFFFSIYMIQFIESKRLSILIFLFCEKKNSLSREKKFLKIIQARKKDIQLIMFSQNNKQMYDFVEKNYLNEYNQDLKKKIKKLQNLIKKKEKSSLKREKAKSVTRMQGNTANKMSNANAYFVQTLKKLLDDSSATTLRHTGGARRKRHKKTPN